MADFVPRATYRICEVCGKLFEFSLLNVRKDCGRTCSRYCFEEGVRGEAKDQHLRKRRNRVEYE